MRNISNLFGKTNGTPVAIDPRISTTTLPKIDFASSIVENEYLDASALATGTLKVVVEKTEAMQNATKAIIPLKMTIADKFGSKKSFDFNITIEAKKTGQLIKKR